MRLAREGISGQWDPASRFERMIGNLAAQEVPLKVSRAIVGAALEGALPHLQHLPDPPLSVDNSRNLYIPVRLSCGALVCVRPSVLVHCPLVLFDINSDMCVRISETDANDPISSNETRAQFQCLPFLVRRNECLRLLPASVHGLIRRTKVWVNRSYACGNANGPVALRHTTAHHHEYWLAHMRDRLDKALGVEIYHAADFRRMRLHWNGSGLLLHEYCHLIHQLALQDGLENHRVKKAHGLAQVTGLYDCVRRRDWAGLERDFDLAYATVDCKEFFAEMSVTYWSQEYDPGLDRQDPSRIRACSPPFTDPAVADRVRRSVDGTRVRPSHRSLYGGPFRQRTPHCNKFYPFTRGQLRHYDKATFDIIHGLWEEIAQWEDPWTSDDNDRNTTCC